MFRSEHRNCSICVILAGVSIVAKHYEWPYKMHSLLPLVARKLANECDTISTRLRSSPPSPARRSHPQPNNKRSVNGGANANRQELKGPRDAPTKTLFQFLICLFPTRRTARPGAEQSDCRSRQVIVSHTMQLIYCI